MKGNFPLKVNAVFQLRIDLPESFAEKENIELQAKLSGACPTWIRNSTGPACN